MSLEYVTAAFVRNVTEQAKICINLKSEDLMEAEETVNENEADSLYAVYLQMMNHVSPGMPVVSTPSHLLTLHSSSLSVVPSGVSNVLSFPDKCDSARSTDDRCCWWSI